MYVIYRHTNTLNGKCYIGKSKSGIDKRWEKHVIDAMRGSELYFHRAIRKYPLESWSHELLEEVETNVEANSCETKWISHFKSNDPTLGYNMTKGGDGGMTCTPEQLSLKMRGKPKSLEHREHIRESQERYWADNPNDSRREQLANRNRTDEGRQKSKDAQDRRWANQQATPLLVHLSIR